ncbi:hypothetical protein KM043_003432 [Ampulex compressa]|nr:hypothetical protein KM043_003432 [Ampulex compressa]
MLSLTRPRAGGGQEGGEAVGPFLGASRQDTDLLGATVSGPPSRGPSAAPTRGGRLSRGLKRGLSVTDTPAGGRHRPPLGAPKFPPGWTIDNGRNDWRTGFALLAVHDYRVRVSVWRISDGGRQRRVVAGELLKDHEVLNPKRSPGFPRHRGLTSPENSTIPKEKGFPMMDAQIPPPGAPRVQPSPRDIYAHP